MRGMKRKVFAAKRSAQPARDKQCVSRRPPPRETQRSFSTRPATLTEIDTGPAVRTGFAPNNRNIETRRRLFQPAINFGRPVDLVVGGAIR